MNLSEKILSLSAHSTDFETLALQVFYYQYQYNAIYRQYCSLIGVNNSHEITHFSAIPYLPIQFFKNKDIRSDDWTPETVFTSSGTSGSSTSKHPAKNLNFYQKIAEISFQSFYHTPKKYCWLALLPAYLEREGSSLIEMVNHFIQHSDFSQSGFFLNDTDILVQKLQENQKNNIPTILIGVSFALWELAETYPNLDLSNIIIMETGGMKGRRQEITRKELHQILCTAFNTSNIHSEYGMTELFSQAYSQGKGIFQSSPTMRVTTRAITDPLSNEKVGKLGVLNICDLGNMDTCSFIASDDLGKVYADGSFEVLGRLDNSDIRGCNLLVVE